MQILYTSATKSFIDKCLKYTKEILRDEVGLAVRTKSFIYNNYVYPFHIVAFEGGQKLGYFDPALMEIGIAKQLMFAEDSVLVEVIKHEIAHLIVHLECGDGAKAHGKEFREVCMRYGWQTSIKATIPFEEVEKKSQRLMSKVAKLLDLSNSSNVHEAKSALNKARSIMVEHGIETVERDDDEFIVVRILEAKRSNEKIKSIAHILRSFFVYPVINHGRGKVYLEIFGKRGHVEIGEYIGKQLDAKLDLLWEREPSLSGLRAKNSFMRGIAEGFVADPNIAKERGVLKVERVLQDNISLAYPHLSQSRSGGKLDKKALDEGRRVGANMKLPKGVKGEKGVLLLT